MQIRRPGHPLHGQEPLVLSRKRRADGSLRLWVEMRDGCRGSHYFSGW